MYVSFSFVGFPEFDMIVGTKMTISQTLYLGQYSFLSTSSIAEVPQHLHPLESSVPQCVQVKLPPPLSFHISTSWLGGYTVPLLASLSVLSPPTSGRISCAIGFALPPGTIVSTQAWSMHHDASVFPSPETFLTDCWLDIGLPPRNGSLAWISIWRHSGMVPMFAVPQMMLRIVVVWGVLILLLHQKQTTRVWISI